MTDVIGALVTWANGALDNASVHGGRVPGAERGIDPGRTVLLRYAGEPGGHGRGYQRFGDVRIDADCYGDDDLAAGELHRELYRELKQLERQLVHGVLLYWAAPSGGAGQAEDPSTGWPTVRSTWVVMASEAAAT